MYTENNQTKKNKKPLLLLIVLGVFGFVMFKFTDVKNIVAKDNNSEASTCATTVVDNSYESNSVFLNISENGNITDVTPQKVSTGNVLGTTSGGGCAGGVNKYSADSACTLPDSEANLTVKGYVSTDAPIVMTSIIAPIRLLSGAFNIQDSNGNITNESQYYPAAGGVIKDKMVEINTAPGELHDETVSEVIDGAVKNKAYTTEYTISTEGESGSKDFTVNQRADNNCGALCDSTVNANPDESNKKATVIKDILYTYPGQTEESSGTTLQLEGTCKNTDTMDLKTAAISVCYNLVNVISGTLGTLFPSADWTNCDANEEGCVNAATIAVKISPMFKETNDLTGTRAKVGMNPESSSTYESVYVITQCKANVANVSVPVKCIWDMSYLFHERKTAEFDDVGGSDTPSVSQYKNFLLQESSTRTDALYSM